MQINKDNRRLLALGGVMALILAFWAGMRYAGRQAELTEMPGTDREGMVLEEAAEAYIPKSIPESSQDTGDAGGEEITVYVAGAVERPDVYKLNAGARVYEALLAASPLPEADLAALGMARKLRDGETIYVCLPGEDCPNEGQPDGQAESATGAPPDFSGYSNGYSGSGPLNINTASAEELDRVLPGVGPALAGRIVDYRANNGPFADISQLKEVSGIGEKKYAAIKDLVTVN